MRNPNATYKGPLSGVRVLDFTWVLAGPQATTVLADYGAEVIRIESKSHPDSYRRGYGPFQDGRRGPNLGGKLNNLNRNKLSMTLDMARPEGREIFAQLVKVADVVAENFTAGVMANWGFAYEGLSAINPRIIYLSMAGLGHNGPQSHYRTFGPTIQALSGLTHLGGLPDMPPSGWGYSYMDHTGGHYGALGVMMALLERNRSGLGQHVDVSQLEAGATLTGDAVPRHVRTGQPTVAPGGEPEFGPACPYGVFPSASAGENAGDDRWVAIAVTDDEAWKALCGVIGRTDLAADSSLATLSGRLARRGEVEAAVSAWTRGRSPHDAMYALQAAGVAAGAVQNSRDLIEDDPQIRARGLFDSRLDHPEMGIQQFEGVPVVLSRTPGGMRESTPLLSEHNRYVLGDLLGMSEDEISKLEEAGIV